MGRTYSGGIELKGMEEGEKDQNDGRRMVCRNIWKREVSTAENWRKWLKIERYGDKYYQSCKILAKPWCLYDVIYSTIFHIQVYLNYLTVKGFQPSLFENKSKMSSFYFT